MLPPPNKASFTLNTIGHSRQGVPLQAYTFGASPPAVAVWPELTPQQLQAEHYGQAYPQWPLPPLNVLYLGAIHGDEPESAQVLFRLIAHLQQEATTLLGPHHRTCIVPITNPDGLLAGTRQNAVGVDLNRNFACEPWHNPEVAGAHYYGGLGPASEPETCALQRLITLLRPQLLLTLHTPYRVVNYDGPSPQAQQLAEAMSALTGYPAEADIGYPTPGSLGTWAGVERRIPTITLELPEGIPATQLWEENREALLLPLLHTERFAL